MNNIYQESTYPEQIIDIIVLGAYNVGKTTLIKKFVYDQTPTNVQHTVAIQFFAKTFHLKGHPYRLKFWDTSGNKKYRNSAVQYFKQASAAILVYDITSYETFHQANQWINELYDHGRQIPVLLIGNKKDLCLKNTVLKDTNRQVSQKQAQQLASSIQGVFVQGCGQTDNCLQLGLQKLIKKHFQDHSIIMEENQINSKCFCC